MRFKVEIDIMPLDALLDPQGKAVSQGMINIDLSEITDVRIGRHIQLFVEATEKSVAIAKVEEACEMLLVNQVMEQYTYTIQVMD